jgi:hypothetical protein
MSEYFPAGSGDNVKETAFLVGGSPAAKQIPLQFVLTVNVTTLPVT